ncbi:MAG TPA: trypsin-like peptidase domain-containing protein [Fontimonas sp.]
MRRIAFPKTLLSSLFVLCSLPTTGQALTPDLRQLDNVPLHVVPTAVTTKALAGLEQRKGSGPAIFAVTADLPVNLDGGVWDQIDAQTDRWRARVYSAGALSLLMEFGAFHLPEGAELWIYDTDGKVVQGPYSARNHSPEGSLWTAKVPGEMAVIELRTPAGTRDAVSLKLARLGHGFKNERDLGESGGCNINTACSLGNDWRNEIRATVKLQIPFGSSVGVCSGTLVNNLAQNNKPYILTADHCGIGESGSPASGVVVYWNFQNSSCSGSDNASDTQNQTGTILRADDRTTDMTLIELINPPSSSFNVYYAGWDSSGAGGNTGVSIHHPSGDAKKISAYTTPLTQSSVVIEEDGPNIPAWRVLRWDQGTTEQGSSGSGLWNQDHLIVGTLSGGSAACSGFGSNDNDQPDFYARLDTQWQANTNSRLRVWLDPNNTGLRKVGGKAPGATATPLPTATPTPTFGPTPTPTPTSTPFPTPTPDDEEGGGGAFNPLMLLALLMLRALGRGRRRPAA